MTALWTGSAPLLLASTSATRRTLLESAGLPVETRASGVDERAVEAAVEERALGPQNLALHLAAEKALAVSRAAPERIVLGADQVLDRDGIALHKPDGRETARAQLQSLSGRSHALHSAVALARNGELVDSFVETALLSMRPLSDAAIEAYLDAAGPEVLKSAGVYQVEGVGIHLFDRIEGDHSTILGLPLLPLLAALRRLGHLAF
ncbi:Maf family protein [Microvirga sp. GCM10011540]|uniref:Maf family protein n=1 Tax=Microvirga sp. GCM10011540 TaxID=3317338 RepID=UPI00361BEAFD